MTKSLIVQGLALQAAAINKKLPKARKVRLWDEFDSETTEPRDYAISNHEMTEDEKLDDPRHDQCRKGKFEQ